MTRGGDSLGETLGQFLPKKAPGIREHPVEHAIVSFALGEMKDEAEIERMAEHLSLCGECLEQVRILSEAAGETAGDEMALRQSWQAFRKEAGLVGSSPWSSLPVLRTVAVAAVAAALLLAAPSPFVAEVHAQADPRVVITPAEVDLEVGASVRLRADVVGADGRSLDASVTWFGAGEAIEVAPDGTVTALRPGDARVAAVFHGRPTWVTVRVAELPAEELEARVEGRLMVGVSAPLVVEAYTRLMADSRCSSRVFVDGWLFGSINVSYMPANGWFGASSNNPDERTASG